ncbi:MAG: histidinol-phosphatase [Chloroflexi bacterium]|nr:MAG: histidinol-phosphatase [Chloroflexota bacterium]RLC95859.1 MAG: histidinol-phosphatase [Chloroflexota bacterium]
MRVDLHIHSRYSDDGVLDPGEIVRIARQKGLDGIAITDHNTTKGGEEAKKHESDSFTVIIGAEIMTEKGEITGLFLSHEVKARRFHEVVSEIKTQGGIVVVPHPFDRLRQSAFHISAEYAHLVDAIEGFNSRCVFQRYNREALDFATRHCLPVVGGSDAHYASEIGLGGIVTGSSDIRDAIVKGDLTLFGKRSPLLNHVKTKLRKLRAKAIQ